MRVEVDEARRDHLARRVDHARCREIVPAADDEQPVARDGHVREEAGSPGAIDDCAAADQKVDLGHDGQA